MKWPQRWVAAFVVTLPAGKGKGKGKGAGVPLERGRQRGTPPKRRYFAVIGSHSVKMVADRYRHGAYHNKHL